MRFKIGKRYGGYEFLDALNNEKTWLVFRVWNLAAQRTELLHILPDQSADLECQERFLRETKVRARLVHPNIVNFYYAGELEGQLVMTTEVVEGTTLAERLDLGPLPWREAIAILSQILRALSCAHSHGVVHRAIAPENIVLTQDKAVKLSGFGLAKAATDTQLTRLGAIQGELKYMPPEQVKGMATLDGRSDIYSAAAVLYEAVTGTTPFGSASNSQFHLMLEHVAAMPQAPSQVRPDVPAALDPVILKAMAKEPAQRFQNADEFREALEEIPAPASETQPRGSSVVPIAFGSHAPVAELAASTPVRGHGTGAGSGAIIVPPLWRCDSVDFALAGVCMFIAAIVAFVSFLTMQS